MHILGFILLAILVNPSFVAAGLRDIGSKRQFFFDDTIVEKMENTKLRLNPATKVVSNPIIKRDKPWEGPEMRMTWFIYDHTHKKFRLRYSTGTFSVTGRNEKGELIVKRSGMEDPGKLFAMDPDTGSGFLICEAFSEDGIHWEKPELGLYNFRGSTANNIVPPEMHRNCFAEDIRDADRSRRYKSLVKTGTTKTKGMTMDYYYSADGYHWTAFEGNPVIHLGEHVGRWGPTTFLGWDPIRKVYSMHMEHNLHMNSPHMRRSIGRTESADMIHWLEAETIVVADDRDYPDTEFYAMPTSFYEGWYLGFLWVFSTTNTTHTPHFAFSRDGVNYNRNYREPIINRGDNGDFDSVMIVTGAPIVHNGEVYCFYQGTNWRSPEQLLALGDNATARIGLAKLPLDGFISLEGARLDYSVVTTRALTFTGKELSLNMRAAFQQWGAWPCEVRVEILNGYHAPIDGYTFADADAATSTSLNQKISWKGKTDVSALVGKPVRLKIYFKNAKLYAFQFR